MTVSYTHPVSYLGEYAKKPKDGRTVVREGDSVYVEIQSYIDDERYVEEYSFNVRVGKTLYICLLYTSTLRVSRRLSRLNSMTHLFI